jgi:DNA invertase Pin-like site-specific DNA recombinase
LRPCLLAGSVLRFVLTAAFSGVQSVTILSKLINGGDIMQQNVFGYIRVSCKEQNEDRQRIALAPLGITKRNLFIDKQSGKNFERPAYKKLIRRTRRGDLLYIKSIDRLGRNYNDIIEQWRIITQEKGVDIRVLDMPLLDTTYCKDLLGTFISDLVLQVLSFTAQLERDNILQRQAEGIAAAKARGMIFGREPLPFPEDFEAVYARWRAGGLTSQDAARLCGFSRRALYEKTQKRRQQEEVWRR